MVRNNTRKTKIGLTKPQVMFEAAKSIFNGGLSTKASAARYFIARTTLNCYVKKCKDCEIDWDHAFMEDVPRLNPYYDNRRIFSDHQKTKQVGQVTSTERGTLITTCGTINALGNSIPPVLISPRVHYKDFIIKGAPHGTLGAATPSG
ncbi:hypothetical protein ILUMI_03806 [Ignelater luminosus]|uniref:HTH psq-type domain-containing protein n=1 Tax=Ignelater luminosus TaxID=2038154 RepID=A0A8K0DAA4_IGNLU|nr:hypothetical protein ILUMI_03806 [Ignelater luminosus]